MKCKRFGIPLKKNPKPTKPPNNPKGLTPAVTDMVVKADGALLNLH